MYSGFVLGLLAFVAIIPLYEAQQVPAVNLNTCSKNSDCLADTTAQLCCSPASTTSTLPSGTLPTTTVPKVCAPTGTVCCTSEAACKLSTDDGTVNTGYCCQSLGICVKNKAACTSVQCSTKMPCKSSNGIDYTCCVLPGTNVGTTLATPPTGTCIPNTGVTSLCLPLK